MSWLEDKIGKVLAEQERGQKVRLEAPKLLDAVWSEVKAIADEAAAKGYNIFFGGNQQHRILQVGFNRFVPVNPEEIDEIAISLAEDGSALLSSGNVSALPLFPIDVCPNDRVVCLKSNGATVSPKQAAEKIMERLLFSRVPAALD